MSVHGKFVVKGWSNYSQDMGAECMTVTHLETGDKAMVKL